MRSMPVVLVALLILSACSPHSPAAPTPEASSPAAAGVPAKISLSAASGVGDAGGTAIVSATVRDAFLTPVAGVTVTFASAAGTIESPVITNDKGVAASAMTAPPGAVAVTVTAGALESKTLVALQAIPPAPPPPQPPPPPPPPPQPPTPTPTYSVTVTPSASSVVAGGFVTLTAAAIATNGAPAVDTWSWDCGNNAPLQTTVAATCTYTTAATVIATVHVSGGHVAAGTGSTTIAVTTAPPPPSYTVTLAASPSTVQTGAVVTLSSPTPVAQNGAPPAASWTWDCGNGIITNTASNTGATCTYTTAGPATARVHVSGGTAVGDASTTITVTPAPVPVVTVNCSSVTLPTTTDCFAIAKVDGAPVTITSATWEWGDSTPNTTTAGGHDTHAYTVALATGGYPVTVTVTVPDTAVKGIGTATAIVH